MIDTGGPVYPSGNKPGITILDYFAGKVIGEFAAHGNLAESCTSATYIRLVEVAYHIAEAMVERRKFLMNKP